MKRIIFCLAVYVGLMAGVVSAKTITELEKDIKELHNECVKIQQNPIVIYGSKQEKLSEEQKNATSTYNINLAQAKERGRYKTKKVITINPVYICSIHKCPYVDDVCKKVGGTCKSAERIGTSNFAGLGSEYDLSYRAWKKLAAKIPEGEQQEKRLREIEDEVASLREEIKKGKDEQARELAEKKKAAMENKKAAMGKKNAPMKSSSGKGKQKR